MQSIKLLSKTVVERRRIYLDYSCWLTEGENLSDFQVFVSPYTEGAPISIDTSYPNGDLTKLMMYISGGLANTTYTLSAVIRTDSGQVKQSDFGLKVYP